MQVDQRFRSYLGNAQPHLSADCRIQHPPCHHNDHASRNFHVDDFTTCAPLRVPGAEPGAHKARAICNELLPPARYGQNDPVMPMTRKAALFAGSDGGARHWAIAMTLIQTAKLNGIEPMAWLTDVLERIVSGRTKAHQLKTLLPWNWNPGPQRNSVAALAA